MVPRKYVWQLPDWIRRLRWDEAQLLTPLAEARRQQGRLLGKIAAVGMDLSDEAAAENLLDDAIQTAAIEGVHLDRDSVRSSVAKWLGLDTAGLPAPRRQVVGGAERPVDGLVQVLVDATENHDQPLAAERIWGWHGALFPTGLSGFARIAVGRWRDGAEPVRVISGRPGRERVHFEAPPAERVPAEMDRFFSWFEDRDSLVADGLLRAGLAYFWFVTIHPLDDGNGRIARAIADMALARDEGSKRRWYSLSAQIAEERQQHHGGLERAQAGDGELTAWLTWYLQCLRSAIARAEARLDRVIDKARFWQRHGDEPLTARQRQVLNRLLDAGRDGFEGGLTTRKYVAIAKTSRATAQREIAELLASGLLVKRRGGGRSSSYDIAWDASDTGRPS